MCSTTSISFKTLWVVLAWLPLMASAQLDNYRNLFFNARGDQGISAFYNSLQSANESNAVHKAYKGVAVAMYAEVVSSVEKKISHFNDGKTKIEAAIQADFWNPEIRFLRFAVQSEIPWFLNYSGNMQEDANIVLDALRKKTIDPKTDFWKKAINFMIDSDELPDSIESELKKFQS